MVKNRINEYRSNKGITQAELAAKMSCDANKSLVSIIETGRAMPTVELMRGMCEVFECSPLDLYDEADLQLISPHMQESDTPDSSLKIILSEAQRAKLEEAIVATGYGTFEAWFREAQRRLMVEHAIVKTFPILSPTSPPCQ